MCCALHQPFALTWYDSCFYASTRVISYVTYLATGLSQRQKGRFHLNHLWREKISVIKDIAVHSCVAAYMLFQAPAMIEVACIDIEALNCIAHLLPFYQCFDTTAGQFWCMRSVYILSNFQACSTDIENPCDEGLQHWAGADRSVVHDMHILWYAARDDGSLLEHPSPKEG